LTDGITSHFPVPPQNRKRRTILLSSAGNITVQRGRNTILSFVDNHQSKEYKRGGFHLDCTAESLPSLRLFSVEMLHFFSTALVHQHGRKRNPGQNREINDEHEGIMDETARASLAKCTDD
jgi:hypothetical protein